ncbi:MAG: hemerythrin domain-containing protein [Deltaproteobacteria bacterium]|nr:hemerythrin domain-containing protein [Deltaproteobacteria bacterium]MBW2392718.1 hemerythrin domain-containing protein [Deltaproteobacteria bacterium]
MTTLLEFMTAAHRRCDEALAAAEGEVCGKNWGAAAQKYQEFNAAMACHFAQEEDVLFPAFEEATGMTEGPTAVMRMEHEQMRSLLAQLASAAGEQDSSRFLGLSETLMILIQQHNMKEEQMLYPMCDQRLEEIDALIGRIEAVGSDSGLRSPKPEEGAP